MKRDKKYSLDPIQNAEYKKSRKRLIVSIVLLILFSLLTLLGSLLFIFSTQINSVIMRIAGIIIFIIGFIPLLFVALLMTYGI